MAIVAIFGGIAAAAGVFGAVSGNQQASQQRADYQQQIDNQYKYDLAQYDFQWNESLREYQYLLNQINIKRGEEETIGLLKDQMSLDQYKYDLKIKDYEYLNQLKQYQESEKIFGKQISFNQIAAQQAADSERQKLRETVMSTAFENQDMMIQLLQQEGLLQARGVSGKSTERQLQSALGELGRNQAVLAESLVSAEKQTGKNLEKIGRDKYGADIAAEANRMLMPMERPDIPVPYRTPRATFLNPNEPQKGPKPIKGTNTAPRPSGLGMAAGILGGIASGVSTYKGLGGDFNSKTG